jgi:hypothetical protein
MKRWAVSNQAISARVTLRISSPGLAEIGIEPLRGSRDDHIERRGPTSSAIGPRVCNRRSVFQQSADLQWEGLLIVGGNTGVETGAKHLHLSLCLAKNPSAFAFSNVCLAAISGCHSRLAEDDPFRPGGIHHTPTRASVSP